jgi:hypothetical protein
MPTILLVSGWRFFFCSNEGNEPVHVHACRAESECKFWLRTEIFEIEEAWTHNMTPRLRREVRKIIFDHFELIVGEWNETFGD